MCKVRYNNIRKDKLLPSLTVKLKTEQKKAIKAVKINDSVFEKSKK